MVKTKYVMSNGLAFGEKDDLKKLQKLSLKGWHVKDFKFMGYVLEKGEPEEYIYSLDYRNITDADKEEYFDLIEAAGWIHIASEGNVHLFRARPGTAPIYSDSDTTTEKYNELFLIIKNAFIPVSILTILSWIGYFLLDDVVQTIVFWIAFTCSIIILLFAWMSIGTYATKLRSRGKEQLANLFIWLLPMILGFTLILYLFFVEIPDSYLRILCFAIIGAISLPLIISIIINTRVKFSAKKSK